MHQVQRHCRRIRGSDIGARNVLYLTVAGWVFALHPALIAVGNPGAVGVTATSLVTMTVKVSFGGQIKEVTEVLSTAPLAEIDSLQVKRMGLAGVMEISAAGSLFKLEGRAGDLKEFAEAFERAEAAA